MRELGERMDSYEFREWMEYADLEPFGEQVADWRSGVIASTVANCHRTTGAAYKPQDFMLRGAEPEQTDEQQIAFMRAFAERCKPDGNDSKT